MQHHRFRCRDATQISGSSGDSRLFNSDLGAAPVAPHSQSSLHPTENVVDRLAALANQIGSDDAGHEVSFELEDFSGSRAIEPFAEDRRHGASQRLNFWTEAHAKMRFAFGIDAQMNADRVGALLILAHVFEIKTLPRARLAILRALRVMHEQLTTLGLGKMLEEIDDFGKARRHIWDCLVEGG
jgi:hypothetical protein